MPCYHARDVAVMRANIIKATVVLGSATPSLESYYNARKGKYTLSLLGVRADTSRLPTVTIVNMKTEFEKAKGYTSFSQVLLDGIKKRYKDGEQTILFLNRRGYHTTLLCQQCQHVVQCQHCDVALTFHFWGKLTCLPFVWFLYFTSTKKLPASARAALRRNSGVGTDRLKKLCMPFFQRSAPCASTRTRLSTKAAIRSF